MKKVGIAIKPGASNAAEVSEKLVSLLKKKKLEIVLGDGAQEVVSSESFEVIPRKELTSVCDLIIVLGGDGTLISVCRYPSKKDCVIIGVNLGTLGFLTEITVEELPGAVEKTLSGEAQILSRSLLQAEIADRVYYAFNDVVLSKQALARIFEVNLSINNDNAAVLRGDGVIVSTPAGSTGYSLSAGGSIVHPSVDAMLIAPICPHSLASRPLVVPGKSVVELGLECGQDVYLTVDGQEGAPFLEGSKIKITTSDYQVRLVKPESRNYYDVLRKKLHWRPGIPS